MTAEPRRHEITGFESPVGYYMRCSCGWSTSQTRHQNAFARANKLRKAVRLHREEIERQKNTP